LATFPPDRKTRKLRVGSVMTVELRELRWAIVASQHRSLRQAAEALNVRQSTLSRSLRGLEHKLGATLFDRTNGGTRPTIEGQEFLDAARRIVEETEAMTWCLKTRSRGESGRLTIGVHASRRREREQTSFLPYPSSLLLLRCRESSQSGT
jgi:DNA-binding transcriptional LysR family regulator